MGAWFHHWVYLDFYAPIWPNIAADLLAAGWIVRRVKKHLHLHHAANERRHAEVLEVLGNQKATSAPATGG